MIGATELGGIPKLMMAEAQNFPEVAKFYFDEVMDRGRDLVRRSLRLGIERGTFRAIDDELIVNVLMAPLIHLATWRYSFACCEPKRMDPRAYLDAYLDLVFHGLLVAGAKESR